MVKRDSKYKTNKRIAKNKKAEVDDIIQEDACYRKIDFSNCNYGVSGEEKARFTKGKGEKGLLVYTDNSHYEIIDKKKQRKKLNRKKKSSDEEEDKEMEGSNSDSPKEYFLKTFKEVQEENTSQPQDSLAYGLEQREINKKLQKEGRKNHIIEGNLNHILNPVEVPETFEFSKRELKDQIVRGAGKKNTLYNGKTTGPQDHFRVKYGTRTRKKRIQKNAADQDMGKTEAYSDKKLHRDFF